MNVYLGKPKGSEADVRLWQIVLQKSQNAVRPNFR
jgi:hypothetical protein